MSSAFLIRLSELRLTKGIMEPGIEEQKYRYDVSFSLYRFVYVTVEICMFMSGVMHTCIAVWKDAKPTPRLLEKGEKY